MATEPGKELLWKYAFGKCEKHELAFVEEWLNADLENRKTLERIKLYDAISESKGGSSMRSDESFQELKEDSPYKEYYLAFGIMILVFILLSLIYFLKKIAKKYQQEIKLL